MKLNEKLSALLHHAAEHDHDCCAHDHDHDEEYEGGVDMRLTVRLVAAALIFVFALIFAKSAAWRTVWLAVSALIAGYDIVICAVERVLHRHALDENVLMVVASLAAFIIGETQEGAAVLILYQVGELLQSYAVGRARKSVEDSFGDRPETAAVIREGRELTLGVQDVDIGDTVVIRPGERVAFDCTVLEGDSTVDMSSLTGESLPVSVQAGDTLLSGCVNLTGVLQACVKASAGESTAARILKIVQSESANKGQTERFISRFARIYTPVVLILAVLAAVLLPLIAKIPFAESIHRALVFLVISCPCALVISVPMAYFAGIGGAARHGMIFKSSAAVDAAAGAKCVVFDKTGTLTNGRLRVSAVRSERMDSDMLLRIAAHAEAYSNHPIARAITEAHRGNIYPELLERFRELPGKGVEIEVDGKPILVGTEAWLRGEGVIVPETEISAEIAVYMSIAGQYAGRILLSDDVKEDAAQTVDALEAVGCRTAMLTGDSEVTARKVAKQLGIREVYAACLPDSKAEIVKSIVTEANGNGTTLFVGEGLNDAPALLSADLGIAMGGLGSDAAIEAAGAIVLDDAPMKVPGMITHSRGVRKIVLQNIAIALGIKLIVLILAACGVAAMWMAVFADVGAAIITVVNALRALRLQ